jgi:hypothetical protein
MYTETARNVCAEQRPIVEKTKGHFMAMTAEQKLEFVRSICAVYKDENALIFNPNKGA